jgi:hypothetical protein
MVRHPDVPDLLEKYMESSGMQECWVTVRELRSYFDLEDSAGPAISGFLQRIHYGHFFSFRYKVGRIEKIREITPPYRIIRKYFVQERPAPKHPPSNTVMDCIQRTR